MAFCLCMNSTSYLPNSSRMDYVFFGYMRMLISIGYGGRSSEGEVNCTSSSADPQLADDTSADLVRLQWSVYEAILPLLIATGVITNVIDLVVLSRPAMRGASYRYLARLALSDLFYLLFNIPFCFQDFADVTRHHPVSRISALYYSHMAVPIVNAFLTMSIYIVVWLSYDRCLAVCSPHKFSARQRLDVVKVRCGISLVLTILIYIPSPLRQTYECVDEGCCVFDSSIVSSRWYITYEFIREFYSRFIPALAITGFNVAIIITLNQVKRARREREPQGDVISESRQERERRLVLLLLAITVLFYISTLPSALYKIIYNHSLAFFPYFRAIADILEVSGHVFNFVVYFLFSPEFRKTLLSLNGNQNNFAMTSSIVQG